MLYPDPRTLQQLIDHHEAPLLDEARSRHLANPAPIGVGSADASGGSASGGSLLRHLLSAVRHPSLQLHRGHA